MKGLDVAWKVAVLLACLTWVFEHTVLTVPVFHEALAATATTTSQSWCETDDYDWKLLHRYGVLSDEEYYQLCDEEPPPMNRVGVRDNARMGDGTRYDWEYAHRTGIVTDDEYRAGRCVHPLRKPRKAER